MIVIMEAAVWSEVVCVFGRQGGKPGAMQSCRTCGGRGIKVTLRQLGPGMVQQMQSVCPDCRGEGLGSF